MDAVGRFYEPNASKFCFILVDCVYSLISFSKCKFTFVPEY